MVNAVNLLFFIYLTVAIRIAEFKIPFIVKLYIANKRGYLEVKNKDTLIQVTINYPIPICSFIARGVIAIALWPVDLILKPALMLKAYILFNRKAISELSAYYTKTCFSWLTCVNKLFNLRIEK